MNIMNTIKIIISLVMLSVLSACGSSSDNSESNATTQMPAALLTIVGPGTLQAFVTIDGNTAGRTEMTIDGTGTGSASASVPGLSLAVHTVLIEYEYTDGASTITLATASNTVDLSSGSGSISFLATDYDLASYDDDSDGVSNADELAAGSDPLDSDCVLDISVIGTCTLG